MIFKIKIFKLLIVTMLASLFLVAVGCTPVHMPEAPTQTFNILTEAVPTPTEKPTETNSPLPATIKEIEQAEEYFDVNESNLDSANKDDLKKYLNKANSYTASDPTLKDSYSTEPVPEGMPQPVDSSTVNPNNLLSCTLLIECSTILNNMDKFNLDKMEVLPADGTIYAAKQISFSEGENVFDILLRETQNERIHMEYESVPGYNSNYIEGISNIYEYDCGELSGWMYSVNGWFPNYGPSRYQVQDGDAIELHYTCDLGRDFDVTWERPH